MTGWRDRPPLAQARQQSPQRYAGAFQMNAFRSPSWGSDQYGTFIDWDGDRNRARDLGDRARSYV